MIYDEPALTNPSQPESPTNPPKDPVPKDPTQPISPTNPPLDTKGDQPVVTLDGNKTTNEVGTDGQPATLTHTFSISNGVTSTTPTEVTFKITQGTDVFKAIAGTDGAVDDFNPTAITLADGTPVTVTKQADGTYTGTVTILPNQTSVTIKVPVLDNSAFEGPEAYQIEIVSATTGNITLGTVNPVATATIYDDGTTDGITPLNPNDPNFGKDRPVLNISAIDDTAVEGKAGDNLIFKVSRDGDTISDITTIVKLVLNEVEADDIASIKYTDSAGVEHPVTLAELQAGYKVTVPASATDASMPTFTIVPKDDTIYEKSESLSLNISGTTNAAQGTTTATGKILDEDQSDNLGDNPNNPNDPSDPTDGDKPVVSITAPTDNKAVEGSSDNTLIYTVAQNNQSNFDTKVTVKPTTETKVSADDFSKIVITNIDGTQTIIEGKDNITDFLTNGKELTIPANTDPSKTITIDFTIVNDNIYEVSEKLELGLQTPSNASIDPAKQKAEGTIFDEDNANPSDGSTTDGDKPSVSITGTTNTNENGTTADGKTVPTYTIAIDNGKTTTDPISVTFKVLTGETATGLTTENADLQPAITVYTVDVAGTRTPVTVSPDASGNYTVNMPVGSTIQVETPIVNDGMYEGAETYRVDLVSATVNNTDVRTTNTAKQSVTTTIYDNGTTDGVTPTPDTPTNPSKDTPIIELDPPAHVSEEGLDGGNKDDNPVGIDSTNKTIESGSIRVKNIDPQLDVTLELTAPTTVVTSGKQPVSWTPSNNNTTWEGRIPNGELVLTVQVGAKSTTATGISYAYTTTLHAPIDHPGKDIEDNFPINFGIVVKQGNTELARENKVVTVVEDDMPISGVSTHVIDVPVDNVKLVSISTGFTDPQTSSTTDAANFVKSNLDDPRDPYYEKVEWGNPGGTGQPRASYSIFEDDTMIDKPIEGLSIPFSLGTFTHDNKGIYVEKGLETIDMHVDFKVQVNTDIATVQTIFDLRHIETPNRDSSTTPKDLPTSFQYGYTADDFVVFKPQESTLLIDGKRYQLLLNKPEKTTGSGILNESIDNFDLLKKMEANYNVDDYTGGYRVYNTKVATMIHTQLDGITREDVASGKVVIINSNENSTNGFKLSATLIPLDPNPDASNDLTNATEFKRGGDVVKDTSLLDLTAQKVIWSADVADSDTNANTYTFKSKYGTFIGKTDGSYEFHGASDISKQVDINKPDQVVYNYSYTDNDGDTIKDTVVINFNDYTKGLTARVFGGTKDHDYIIGTSLSGDELRGGAGDDTIIGEAGADKLYGDAGNDDIVYDPADTVVDGDEGYDTLVLVGTPYQEPDGTIKVNSNINLTGTIAKDFEVLSMKNGTTESLTITAADVLNINSTGKTLDILGDASDTVTATGFTKADEAVLSANDATKALVREGFDLYTATNGATLYISETITHIIL
ncbi:Calx-beta domain-containing protein [Moraxella sp. TY5]|uniref:calcium-binding protein n=1 Tax=Moraxella sp. TY5 TaxID=3387627 RepID=UPI003AF5AC22